MGISKEQNGATFSFIAPSSEELWVLKENRSDLIKIPYYSRWFWPENENLTLAIRDFIAKDRTIFFPVYVAS